MSKLIEKIAVIAVTLLIWMLAAHLRPSYEERTGRGMAPVQAKNAGSREAKADPQRISAVSPAVFSKFRPS
jgi:hypothetical protein